VQAPPPITTRPPIRGAPPAPRASPGNKVRALGRPLLEGLSQRALFGLGRLARRFPAATVFLGVLFIPTNSGKDELETEVPGHPGLRIGRLIGTLSWHIYDNNTGQDTWLQLKPDGSLRDPSGRPVARLLPHGHLAFDLDAIDPRPAGAAEDDRPRLCPAPSPDKRGQGKDSISRAYENQMKALINPENPTPDGMAIACWLLPGLASLS